MDQFLPIVTFSLSNVLTNWMAESRLVFITKSFGQSIA